MRKEVSFRFDSIQLRHILLVELVTIRKDHKVQSTLIFQAVYFT